MSYKKSYEVIKFENNGKITIARMCWKRLRKNTTLIWLNYDWRFLSKTGTLNHTSKETRTFCNNTFFLFQKVPVTGNFKAFNSFQKNFTESLAIYYQTGNCCVFFQILLHFHETICHTRSFNLNFLCPNFWFLLRQILRKCWMQ